MLKGKLAKSLVGAVVVAAATAGNAMAAITIPATLSIADWESVMGLVIVGLAALWAGRKVIKTLNRS